MRICTEYFFNSAQNSAGPWVAVPLARRPHERPALSFVSDVLMYAPFDVHEDTYGIAFSEVQSPSIYFGCRQKRLVNTAIVKHFYINHM